MIQFICYFFPALVSLSYEIKLKGRVVMTPLQLLLCYALNVIVINCVIFAFLMILPDSRFIGLSASTFNVDFTFKYLVCASVLSWCVPNVKAFIKERVSIGVKVERK